MENDIEHATFFVHVARQSYSLFYLMRNHKISLVSYDNVMYYRSISSY